MSPDAHAKLGEERRLQEHDRAPGAQGLGRPGGFGLKVPVEGEGALERVDLDKPKAARGRKRHHGREHLLARHLARRGRPGTPGRGRSSGAGEVTKRSAPRSPFASDWIALRTFELNEPIETRAAMPRTTESEYRRSLRREARESRQAMIRTKLMGPGQRPRRPLVGSDRRRS